MCLQHKVWLAGFLAANRLYTLSALPQPLIILGVMQAHKLLGASGSPRDVLPSGLWLLLLTSGSLILRILVSVTVLYAGMAAPSLTERTVRGKRGERVRERTQSTAVK